MRDSVTRYLHVASPASTYFSRRRTFALASAQTAAFDGFTRGDLASKGQETYASHSKIRAHQIPGSPYCRYILRPCTGIISLELSRGDTSRTVGTPRFRISYRRIVDSFN